MQVVEVRELVVYLNSPMPYTSDASDALAFDTVSFAKRVTREVKAQEKVSSSLRSATSNRDYLDGLSPVILGQESSRGLSPGPLRHIDLRRE